MRIAILGATGQTGQQAVLQALDSGHSVTALVSDLFTNKCAQINLSEEELSSHLGGHDAVLSCLGFKPQKPAVTGYLEVTRSLVGAMRSVGLNRLVLCHSWYTEEESRGQASFLIRWILIPMIRTVLDNMRRTEEWLEQQEGLQYTVVRPAGLTNGPKTESEIQECIGFFVPGASSRISRADVARFMLDSIGKSEHHAKQFAIAV